MRSTNKPVKLMRQRRTNVHAAPVPVFTCPLFNGQRVRLDSGLVATKGVYPVVNSYVRERLNEIKYPLEGYIIVGDKNDPESWLDTSRWLTRHYGEPEFHFYATDFVSYNVPFAVRLTHLYGLAQNYAVPEFCTIVKHRLITNKEKLFVEYREKIADGYAGLIAHAPQSMYIPAVDDNWSKGAQRGVYEIVASDEAVAFVLDIFVTESGTDSPTTRAVFCMDPKTLTKFEICSTLTHSQRKYIYRERKKVKGWGVKYTYSSMSKKGKPVLPAFVEFVSPEELIKSGY